MDFLRNWFVRCLGLYCLGPLLAAMPASATVIVEATDIPGGDFSNISNMPTDLQGQIDNLQTEDTIFGHVDLPAGDVLDVFSFLLEGNGEQLIAYSIFGFNGQPTGGAVYLGNQFGDLLATATITSNGSGLLTFNVDTGGDYLPFVIRFDPPQEGSYSFRVGVVPEPSTSLLLGVAALAALARPRRRS
jgi:hypothetical protein